MGELESLHSNGGVLLPVLFEVQRQLFTDGRCQYLGAHLGVALGKQDQHAFIDIVVDQENPMLGGTNQVADKGVGVKNLAIEENPLLGFDAFIFQRVENLFKFFVGFRLMFYLRVLKRFVNIKQKQ